MKEILLLEKKDSVIYTNELNFDKGLIVVKTIGGQLIGTVVKTTADEFLIIHNEIEVKKSTMGNFTYLRNIIYENLDSLIKANKSCKFFLIE